MTTRRQNSRFSIIAVLLCVACPMGLAQSGDAAPAPAPGSDAASGAGLPAVDIEKLVAPIALYPDVLVSQILPAATFPTQIVQAARWCKGHADLQGLDQQPWDLSVISICRYAPVLAKMDQDLDWTNALGAAFMDQPEDVMSAIQKLRRQAESAGVLKSSPQQTVVSEEQVIRIVPAEKEIVYVPQYNPQVIYVEDDDDDAGLVVAGAATAAISFGAGLALGAWLDNDCDWGHGCVVACRPGYWGGYPYRGAVAWDNDWAAIRGPRRGLVAGENGGAYIGPRGAAIWGDNGHGAAWSRPAGYGAPVYGGRYAGYNNNRVGNRNVASGNVRSGNTINVNQNNVNIDRGDRTNVRGGDRTNVGGGDRNRTNVGGGDRTNSGDRSRTDVGRGDRTDGRGSAFDGRQNAGNAQRDRERGQQSRENAAARPAGGEARPQPTRQPAAQPSPERKPSSFNSSRSGGEAHRQSSRGASSRGGGGGRGGGRRG